jgi:putative phosphoribosyl transferase
MGPAPTAGSACGFAGVRRGYHLTMGASTQAREVAIAVDRVEVHADLGLPEGSRAVVVFAHGGGSSRHSPRNRRVAERLQRDGLGTLLLDLLTEEEDAVDVRTGELRFDIGLLADRLVRAVGWLDRQQDLSPLAVGFFGASTGAAAALVGAAHLNERIGAVVSRGGRPDLAGDHLSAVRAPTLLIVGGRDDVVLGMNRRASERMRCERTLEVVPGATHLFEEPGALDRVATMAADWFGTHLAGVTAGDGPAAREARSTTRSGIDGDD